MGEGNSQRGGFNYMNVAMPRLKGHFQDTDKLSVSIPMMHLVFSLLGFHYLQLISSVELRTSSRENKRHFGIF